MYSVCLAEAASSVLIERSGFVSNVSMVVVDAAWGAGTPVTSPVGRRVRHPTRAVGAGRAADRAAVGGRRPLVCWEHACQEEAWSGPCKIVGCRCWRCSRSWIRAGGPPGRYCLAVATVRSEGLPESACRLIERSRGAR